MKLYANYSQRHIIDWNFTQDTSLNGFYDLSFFLAYPEYQLLTLTVRDWINTNSWKFLIAEYDSNIISPENISLYIDSIPKEFNLQFLLREEARQLLRETYKEESEWVFVLQEETIWMSWETIPEQTLIIE